MHFDVIECTWNSDSDEDTFITQKPAQKNVTVEPREQIKGVSGIALQVFFSSCSLKINTNIIQWIKLFYVWSIFNRNRKAKME